MRGVQLPPRPQRPAARVEPDADSPGALAAELAATAGLLLDPWQQLVLLDALALRPDGRWAAREVGLICPRQQGKGSVLEALELARCSCPSPVARRRWCSTARTSTRPPTSTSAGCGT